MIQLICKECLKGWRPNVRDGGKMPKGYRVCPHCKTELTTSEAKEQIETPDLKKWTLPYRLEKERRQRRMAVKYANYVEAAKSLADPPALPMKGRGNRRIAFPRDNGPRKAFAANLPPEHWEKLSVDQFGTRQFYISPEASERWEAVSGTNQ